MGSKVEGFHYGLIGDWILEARVAAPLPYKLQLLLSWLQLKGDQYTGAILTYLKGHVQY